MSLLPLLTYAFSIRSQMCDNETQIFTFPNVNYLRIFKLGNFYLFPTQAVLGSTPSAVPTKDNQHNDGISPQNVWWVEQVAGT